MKVVLSPLAEFKLDSLLKYLEEEWGVSAKMRFMHHLESSIRVIEKFPEAFPKSEIEFELYKCVVTHQTSLYYRIKKDVVEILTVFDNRQNPEVLAKEIRQHFG
jgi:plasmid stabilization system protein ParE